MGVVEEMVGGQEAWIEHLVERERELGHNRIHSWWE